MLARLLLCWSVLVCPILGHAAPKALLSVNVGDRTYTGTIHAHDSKFCWLMGQDGRLDHFAMEDVSQFREIGPEYKPLTSEELRGRLAKEFGSGYEIAASNHYLVCANRGDARRYAQFFEELYRQFVVYFGARGFPMKEPQFPLVAIVFPRQEQFGAYCRSEGFTPQKGMVGYYVSNTNRVALFDEHSTPDGVAWGVHSTIIHEATHQMAFNTGLHSRVSQDPQWLVEGLATTFESEAVRLRSREDVRLRLNPERFQWFMGRLSQRPAGRVRTVVAEDSLFQTATLDAYAEAWALTFFLLETRSSEYTSYLKQVQQRKATKAYSTSTRLADFEASFGEDWERLDRDLVKFYTKIGQ